MRFQAVTAKLSSLVAAASPLQKHATNLVRHSAAKRNAIEEPKGLGRRR